MDGKEWVLVEGVANKHAKTATEIWLHFSAPKVAKIIAREAIWRTYGALGAQDRGP